MDIEGLNKTQIILLTLLVSFVTSIATGIATVSLIEKAPTDVTRVINRIVEKPIETIIPGEKEVITKTVVVQESDLIAQSVETIRPSIVKIYEQSRSGSTFVALGVVADEKGTVYSDPSGVKNRTQYLVVLNDGKQLTFTSGTAQGGLVTLMPDESQGNEIPSFTPVKRTDFSKLALGETVVALGLNQSYIVAPGVITQITSPSSGQEVRGFVNTTVDMDNLVFGSPLITNNGELVGMLYSSQPGVFRSVFAQQATTASAE